MQGKIKIKPKHREIAEYHASAVDAAMYPNFKLDDQIIERFIRFESQGRKALTFEEIESIRPLIGHSLKHDGKDVFGAKQWMEVTVAMMHDELAEVVAARFGYYYVMASNIRRALWPTEGKRYKPHVEKLLTIAKSIREEYRDGGGIHSWLIKRPEELVSEKKKNLILQSLGV